ncbi:RNA polymerase-associated protein RapA [Chitinivorax sp. B]|uniref:RNA polymerase-associated protein RapA n=1 Tax=Chitinivorax sp. B TaxID=2502235 RepID=UPI002016B5A9|nr:RNA polymerase-associated protein RapA [Chitinivorax sp. B]
MPNMQTFVPGQRWISDTETELGLGVVIECDLRLVRIGFPASDETRVYARNNAPLTRVHFNAGDTVSTRFGWKISIQDVTESAGLLTYIGTRAGKPVELPEGDLDHYLQFSQPQQRLFNGQLDREKWFYLRYETLKHLHELEQSPLTGLRGPRTSLIPHQLYIAREVANRAAPRVLLADEVGLGKTIEAGLILSQQLLTERVSRVLIVVPEALQHQWLVEMLRRFNLHVSLFDEERCVEFDETEDNPFEAENIVLVSTNLMAKKPKRLEQALAAGWDMMIVDEAHHLIWEEHHVSKEYAAIEKLARETPSVLLLTATPEQLGQASHFARLRLLDPDRFYDFSAFLEEEANFVSLAEAAQAILDNDLLPSEWHSQLSDFVDEDQLPLIDLLADPLISDDERTQARDTVLSNLIDRHGTGRLLFRNTRATVKGFPGRDVHTYPMTLPIKYELGLAALEEINPLLYPEMLADEDWLKFDPRVNWLVKLLKEELRGQKVLIICHRALTAIDLEEKLRLEGLRTGVFHEGMSLTNRDRASAYFADPVEGAQALVCSEIGSEGRNFQFAHHLVLFDIPLSPDLLEQRIGRLDRIGQTETINLHIPYFEHTAQHALLRWMHEGIDALRTTCPAGHTLYEVVEEKLLAALFEPTNTDAIGKLIAQSQKLNEHLTAELEQGRDRLLELNSCRQPAADELCEQILEEEDMSHLDAFMETFFGAIGVDVEEHSRHVLKLEPGENMLIPHLPTLEDEGTLVTFDRDMALSREDVQFLTWEHPMVRAALDWMRESQHGNAVVSVMQSPRIKAGTVMVETLYTVQCSAPKHLRAGRFLPPMLLRNVIDPNGRDVELDIRLRGCERVGVERKVVNEILRLQQAQIRQILEMTERKVETDLPKLIKQATAALNHAQDGEIARMKALRAVNPSVPQIEIDFLVQEKEQLQTAIDNAQLRLEAIRVIIAA